MKRNTFSAALIAVAALFPATLLSAAAASPCAGPEWKRLDFWVGEWRATWPATPGNPAGSATNRIEKILGGCVVAENFAGDGQNALVGKSWSTYDAKTKTWRQTWVDNQSSYLDFTGDFSSPNETIFAMDSTGAGGKPVKLRMVFKNISADAFDWSWERSADGGKSWEVRWPIHYARKKP